MARPPETRLEILTDPETLAHRVAEWIVETAIAKEGAFSILLSGGSTPKRLYQLLAGPLYAERFPWARTHWFWGDERFVAKDDADSNFGMVRDAMLAHAPIPPENIHAVPTENITPRDAAGAYEAEIKAFYGAERIDPARPIFDITLLGLGPDGHIASLFPDTAVLTEREQWVAAVLGPKASGRITLTYPALDSSRAVAFLIAGEEKTAIFNRLYQGDDTLPAAQLHPAGEVIWFLDKSAAGDKRW